MIPSARTMYVRPGSLVGSGEAKVLEHTGTAGISAATAAARELTRPDQRIE